MQASKFELVINAETARMLGVEVPHDAARARRRGDRVKRREFISTPALRGDRRADRDTRDEAGQRGVRARAKADMRRSHRLTGPPWRPANGPLNPTPWLAPRSSPEGARLSPASREERTTVSVSP